jgi:hypothetical protein
MAVRALDWNDTEECIRRPWAQCHEKEHLSALVHIRTGFVALEVGAAQYELPRHGLHKLAWCGQVINARVLVTRSRSYPNTVPPDCSGARTAVDLLR